MSRNTSTVEKYDGVLIGDSNEPGTVIQDGAFRSLVSRNAPPQSGCSEIRDWFDNDGLKVTHRRQSRIVGDEPDSIIVIEGC